MENGTKPYSVSQMVTKRTLKKKKKNAAAGFLKAGKNGSEKGKRKKAVGQEERKNIIEIQSTESDPLLGMRSPEKGKRKTEKGKQKKAAVQEERKNIIEIQITESDPLLGMRKWLSEYHSKRPGFKVLQQQIDDYIGDFEAEEEKARQEREAAAAEEGWTVVEQRKGRKKTTDMESGISVGGVSSAAVEKKRKKQIKDSALNFYRFQRREARRNEILELQQRFEEDKKKIATLRATRKFRPY